MNILVTLLILLSAACYADPTPQQIRASMDAYRKTHSACEACGKPRTVMRKLAVHHIKPQEAFPSLAANTNNFIMLCGYDHLTYGHNGDYGKYVENIRAVLKLRVIKANQK